MPATKDSDMLSITGWLEVRVLPGPPPAEPGFEITEEFAAFYKPKHRFVKIVFSRRSYVTTLLMGSGCCGNPHGPRSNGPGGDEMMWTNPKAS